MEENKQEINGRLELLKKEFPECFDRDGNFNIEKFQETLNPDTKIFKDSYGLNWLGKSYARYLGQGEPKMMLREDVEHNKKEKNRDSENMYIKGDNLEVLKHLHGGYRGSVKMIYIDPPYNTKSGEFVYNDNRDFKEKDLKKLVESNIISEDEMERIKKWEGESSSHSAWLTFMFPRLYLARKLLTEDGVTFISIDENEIAQLKLMCDEIFGEENYVQEIVWEKKYSPQNDAKYFSLNHEQVLCYAKNKSKFKRNLLPMTEEQKARYKNLDNDERGTWKGSDFSVATYNAKYDYPIETPSGKVVNPSNGRCWATTKENLKVLLEENRIWFGKNGDGIPRLKKFLSDTQQGKVPISLFYYKEVGHTQSAAQDLKKIFDGKKYFDYPKPVELVKRCLYLGTSSNDIILDFFSGSATTAHAVNKLNLEDGGNRRWIMVQLEEKIDPKKSKDAFNFCTENNLPTNITSIGIERIKRANKQILDKVEEEKDEFDRGSWEKRLGFKVYSTRDKIRELNIQDEFSPELTTYEPMNLSGNDTRDIVNTYKLQDGYPLTTEVVEENLSWEKTVIGSEGSGRYIYTSYRVEDTLYLIHPINSSDVCKSIISKLDTDPEFKVGRVVVYGFTNIESKYRMELIENIKTYSNKKSAHIDFEVRY